ncbi:MAG: WXG100 family type VII secretion target [Candidatus Thorarchaeota archaeon]
MPILHVEPEELFLASRAFWRATYETHEQLTVLRMTVARLEMAWSGSAADEFLVEMNSIVRELSRMSEELCEMELLLARQADLWIEADQRWAALFRDSH